MGRPILRRAAVLAIAAAGSLTLAGCAEDEPTDFTADNRSSFMAACSQPLDDTALVGDICQCVFEQTQAEFQSQFGRFATIDQQLKDNPDRVLPPEINGIIADCVIEEAGL